MVIKTKSKEIMNNAYRRLIDLLLILTLACGSPIRAEEPQKENRSQSYSIRSFIADNYLQATTALVIGGTIAYAINQMAKRKSFVYQKSDVLFALVQARTPILSRMVTVTRGKIQVVLSVACLLVATRNPPLQLLKEVAVANPKVILWMMENTAEVVARMSDSQFASLGELA